MTEGETRPVRPRQHQLEDRSEAHFALATPEEWVARPVPKDYGIDYEVEIFEELRRTGLTFKVQLKSTDKESASWPVRVSDLDYWRTLDVPVLLVLYRASTDEVLSHWAHAHNPWPQVEEDQQTTTVHFTELYSDHVKRIPRELGLVRKVKFRATQTPVTIGIQHPDPGIARGLRHVLRNAIETHDLRRTVKVVINDPYVTVSFTGDTMVAAAPANVSSMTAHGWALAGLDDLPAMPPNILALVSMLLSRVGSDRAAADLLLGVLHEVSDDIVGSFAPSVAAVLAGDERWHALATLLDVVMVDPEVCEAMYGVALLSSPYMPLEAALLFIEFGRRAADDLTVRGMPADASQRHYVAALFAVDHDMWEDVHADLAAAFELVDDFYDNDRMYHQLRGKAYWNLGDLAAALDHYERAWELGWQTIQAVAAYGEALFMAGRYEQARQHFENADEGFISRWALLVHCVAVDVIRITGVAEQVRRPFTEDDPGADELETTTDPDVLMAALRERDATNAALLERYLDATNDVALGSLLASALVAGELGRWTMAIAAAHKMGAPQDLARAIVEQATIELPEVVDVLEDVNRGLTDHAGIEAIDPEYIDWARKVADSAEPDGGPPPRNDQAEFWSRVRITNHAPGCDHDPDNTPVAASDAATDVDGT